MEKKKDPRTYTTEQFVEKCQLVHGDKYDYSKVIYKSSKEKVLIICPKHGEFSQIAAGHLTCGGCKKCGVEKRCRNQLGKPHDERKSDVPLTQEQLNDRFIERAEVKFGDRYDYSQVQYSGNSTDVTIICKIHGPFQQWPETHLKSSHGCPECVNEAMSRMYMGQDIVKGYKSLAMTQDELNRKFIEKAQETFGDKYDYSKVHYIKTQTHGCKVCGLEKRFGDGLILPSDKTLNKLEITDHLVRKAKEVHGDLYDYSKTVFTASDEKLEIVCKIHGSFFQLYKSHISQATGCPTCARERIAKLQPGMRIFRGVDLTYLSSLTERFIVAARMVHENLYDYSHVNYENYETNVRITCNVHGSFNQTPESHLFGNGCSKCSKKYHRTCEEFISAAKAKFSDKFDYSLVHKDYKSVKDKVHIVCPKHGSYWQSPECHLVSSFGCVECSNFTASESLVRNTLKEFLGIPFPKKRPPFLKGLELDGYNEEKKIAFEYDGKQHFEFMPFFHRSIDDFHSQQERDRNKSEICNSLGITLIRVPYHFSFEKPKELAEFVKSECKKLNLIV